MLTNEVLSTELPKGNYRVLDIAATRHVTGYSTLLRGINRTHESMGKRKTSGDSFPVLEQGDLSIKLPDSSAKKIRDVLYVPGLQRNLLSVGRVTNSRLFTCFDS